MKYCEVFCYLSTCSSFSTLSTFIYVFAHSWRTLNRQALTLNLSTNCRSRKHTAIKVMLKKANRRKQDVLYLSAAGEEAKQIHPTVPSPLYLHWFVQASTSIKLGSSVGNWCLGKPVVTVLLGVCTFGSELESKRVKERGRRESTAARKGHSACSAVRYSPRCKSIKPTPIIYTHRHSSWIHCRGIRMVFNEAHVTVRWQSQEYWGDFPVFRKRGFFLCFAQGFPNTVAMWVISKLCCTTSSSSLYSGQEIMQNQGITQM